MARHFFRGLLDRAVLVAGTVAGGCVPGFIIQYRQRVEGRLDQVDQDLAPFRAIAERFHGGSLDALIKHQLVSPDSTFRADGAAIQTMVDSELLILLIWKGLATLFAAGGGESGVSRSRRVEPTLR